MLIFICLILDQLCAYQWRCGGVEQTSISPHNHQETDKYTNVHHPSHTANGAYMYMQALFTSALTVHVHVCMGANIDLVCYKVHVHVCMGANIDLVCYKVHVHCNALAYVVVIYLLHVLQVSS